jgi:hypothetical protein
MLFTESTRATYTESVRATKASMRPEHQNVPASVIMSECTIRGFDMWMMKLFYQKCPRFRRKAGMFHTRLDILFTKLPTISTVSSIEQRGNKNQRWVVVNNKKI